VIEMLAKLYREAPKGGHDIHPALAALLSWASDTEQ
jgi:hypothetical protein